LPKKAAGYIRVSRYRNDEGISPENQKQKIELQAKMLDAKLIDVYTDLDISGKSTNRPEFQQLMKQLDKYDYIIVYKLSRFSRSVHDFHTAMQKLDKYSVTLVSVSENIDTSTPVGRLIRNVLVDFSQFEREIIAEQIRDNLIVNAKQGRWNGGRPPYGYEFKDKQLFPLLAEVNIVQYIFKRFAEGYGANIVRNELYRMGVTPPNGQKYWRKNTIIELVRNPVYIGQLRYAGQVYNGQHEAIIDESLWRSAQEKLQERSDKAPRELSSKHLLSGLIVCSKCGKKLHVRYNGRPNNKVRRYFCGNRNDGVESCKCPILDADSLDKAVTELIFDLVGNADGLKSLIMKNAAWDIQDTHTTTNLEKELIQVRKAMKDMFALYSKGKITEEQLEMMNTEYLRQESDLKERLQQSQMQDIKAQQFRLNLELIIKEAKNFKLSWQYATIIEKRNLLKQFIKNLTVTDTSLIVSYQGLGNQILVPQRVNATTMFF
jgi:site-specific DNA recombinase